MFIFNLKLKTETDIVKYELGSLEDSSLRSHPVVVSVARRVEI